MPTLGTQTISSSFAQLLKTFTTGGLSGALQVVTDGDDTSSALSLSTTGVSSTGSFSVDGASILSGAVTFGSNITASTGTATIGTLFASGPATFGTSLTASTGTATIGTLSASTATISTATIPLQLGNITFGSNITASTGTATIGTEIVSTSTIGTLNVSGTATVGSLEIGGTAGPLITKISYGTAAFTLSTVQPHNLADTTTGTFALTGAELGDIVIGSINSLGSTTGTAQIMTNFYPIASNVVRYAVIGKGTTAGTVPAGTIFATAMRFIA
jgi:hypothetical protein